MSQERNQTKKCTQEGSPLQRVMMLPSSGETFQRLIQQIDFANPDRIRETEGASVNYPEQNADFAKDCRSVRSVEDSVLVSGGDIETLIAKPFKEDNSLDKPEEDSAPPVSGRDDETLATNVKDDESNGNPSQGLCTYLNLAPTVETEEQKLNALDELIRKSWEIEALGLVEEAPKVSNDHSDPSAD